MIPSVVLVAVKVHLSGVVSVTTETTVPLESEGPFGGAIVAWQPGLAVNVTVWPTTGKPLASSKLA